MMYCDCNACEQKDNCKYKDCYERLPREYYKGAKSLCPKLNAVNAHKEKDRGERQFSNGQKKNILFIF